MSNKVFIFDSTLRDGAQADGISFSVEDKVKVVKALDEIGVDYIEAGNPMSNPKDMEFFDRIAHLELSQARIVAFGSTRKSNISPQEDAGLKALEKAGTSTVAIFGKCWDFHVTDIIETSLEENLNMIRDSVAYLKSLGKEVIFDGEHFFDGFKNNSEYAMQCLAAAAEAGADCIVLCDTNGGTFPSEVHDITRKAVDTFSTAIGIHCHNDCGMAVANSQMAVEAGARHVQGTFIGYGERCGNANLSTIIPNLQLKRKMECIPEASIPRLTMIALTIAEISNISLNKREPYVGRCAFTHKGGMHVDAVNKTPQSFEHIDPEAVGNRRIFLTSEVAGRGAVISKIQKVSPELTKDSPETTRIIKRLKELEHAGYQFEAAESSFELIIRKELGKYRPLFELVSFKVIGEQPYREGLSATALIKIIVDGKEEITAAEGEGPVNALDKALRKALEVFYPEIAQVYLIDYKVRVLDGKSASASKVRVLIESTDGKDTWASVGVSRDIIEASWLALVDSVEYKLIKDIESKFKAYL